MLKRTLTGAGITVAVYLILYYSYVPGVLSCAVALMTAFAVYEIYGAAGMARHPVGLPSAIIAMMAAILADEYPDFKGQLVLPDEKSRRVGQSYAAAGLVSLK